MKNIFKKNQIIITALAIMIAVAGYLNYSGSRLDTDELAQVAVPANEDDVLLDLSEADLMDEAAEDGIVEEIESHDVDLDDLESVSTDPEAVAEADTDSAAGEAGEAVLASSGTVSVGIAAQAKITREQTRAKNKETLLEVINNANITDDQKQNAINEMIQLTEISEKETAAELLLEAKGFADAVVSVTGDTADVVVNMADMSDSQRAQIEDIVKRKTGVLAENIVITSMSAAQPAESSEE